MKQITLLITLTVVSNSLLGMQLPQKPIDQLFEAIEADDEQKVDKILKASTDKKALVNSLAHGFAALRRACYLGNINIFESILNAGRIIEPEDTSKITPLMAAAQSGHVDAVKLLLTYSANPDAKDIYGQTTLDYANRGKLTDQEQAQISQLLKDSGKKKIE